MDHRGLWLIACLLLLRMALPRANHAQLRPPWRAVLSVVANADGPEQVIAGAAAAGGAQPATSRATVIRTATPITHVIVLIGENRSFDHVYATYVPKRGERVSNLLSKGIVNVDGSPGPHYRLATQFSAVSSGSEFAMSPPSKTPYTTLPPVGTGTAPTAPGDTTAPFIAPRVAQSAQPDLPASVR